MHIVNDNLKYPLRDTSKEICDCYIQLLTKADTVFSVQYRDVYIPKRHLVSIFKFGDRSPVDEMASMT